MSIDLKDIPKPTKPKVKTKTGSERMGTKLLTYGIIVVVVYMIGQFTGTMLKAQAALQALTSISLAGIFLVLIEIGKKLK